MCVRCVAVRWGGAGVEDAAVEVAVVELLLMLLLEARDESMG